MFCSIHMKSLLTIWHCCSNGNSYLHKQKNGTRYAISIVASFFLKTLKVCIKSLMVSQQPSAAWCLPGSHDGPLGHYCLTALDSLEPEHRQATDRKCTLCSSTCVVSSPASHKTATVSSTSRHHWDLGQHNLAFIWFLDVISVHFCEHCLSEQL